MSKKFQIGFLGFILFFYRDQIFIKLDHNFLLLNEYQCTVRGESLHEKACFFNVKKAQISCAQSTQLISSLVFRYLDSAMTLLSLHHLLWLKPLYSLVCRAIPGWKPKDRFSHDAAQVLRINFDS